MKIETIVKLDISDEYGNRTSMEYLDELVGKGWLKKEKREIGCTFSATDLTPKDLFIFSPYPTPPPPPTQAPQ